MAWDARTVFDVAYDSSENCLQVRARVVAVNYNRLQATLQHMLIPVLVKEFSFASNTKDQDIQTALLIELHLRINTRL